MTVATQSIYTSIRYRDAMAAIDFIERAFGFERGDVHQGEDGDVHHAEPRFTGEATPRATSGASGPTGSRGAVGGHVAAEGGPQA